MMRLSILITTLALAVFPLLAAPIDPLRAKQVAASFAPKAQLAPERDGESAIEGTIVYTHCMPKSGRPAIFVVNIGNAFVLISADDVAHPVLGYNDSKAWPVYEQDSIVLPPQVKGFLDDLATQMEEAAQYPQNASVAAEWQQPRAAAPCRSNTNPTLPDSVGPLLTTTWGQGQYYNAMCPADGQSQYDGHVPTGCVATAMAQIINYWGQQQPFHTRGIHSYDSNYGTLTVNYDSTSYDFANMSPQLTDSSTQQEIDAVAKLMYECGVAVNMEYGTSESGAQNINARAALVNFFQFSSNLSLTEKAYYNETEWENVLYSDLAKGYPIYYSGTYMNSAHAFICDGYKNDGCFHFNFGWGGDYDGWFRHSAVLNYNTSQCAMLGIVPDSTANVILCQTQGKNYFSVTEQLEYCDILGYNAYKTSSGISCSGTTVFVSENTQRPFMLEILNFYGQEMRIYDGEGENVLLRRLSGNDSCDLSNIISSQGVIEIMNQSSHANATFQIVISRPENSLHVKDFEVKIEKNGQQCVVIADWNADLDSCQWQIRYRRKDILNDTYTILSSTSHPDTIYGIALGYQYEFGVRAICDTVIHNLWTILPNVLIDLPRWTDVVTSQPDGYVEDEDGNVYISSAEGLAWLSVMVGGLNGQLSHSFAGKIVLLMSDINLDGYRWYPISRMGGFLGIFNGQNHTISNMYVHENNNTIGLFGAVNGIIKNTKLLNGHIRGQSNYVGGLVGGIADGEIINCHSSVDVEGLGYVGGLCGHAFANGGHIIISDCSATGTVYGSEPCGGLIGAVYGDVDVKNCYALGDVLMAPFTIFQWDIGRGGLIGAVRQYSNIINCYSAGKVYTNFSFSHPLGKLIGYLEGWVHLQYAYALDSVNVELNLVGEKDHLCVISDTTQFYKISGTNTLINPIQVDNELYTDLSQALNAWVTLQNDQNLHAWIVDSNIGFLVHGENISISCYNPTSLSVSNVSMREDTVVRTRLEWEQMGNPIAWEVLYVTAGQDIELGTILSVNENPCTLTNIPAGRTLNIYVRAVCDEGHSQWCNPVTYIPDKLHWTDVVMSQPEGYVEDSEGNVYISSAEGLAWLSKMVLEMDRSQAEIAPLRYETKTIELSADIDLSAYRWTPIGYDIDHEFRCHSFKGNNYVISGLYCNDLKDYQGLFGCFNGEGTISNLTIKHCSVFGENKVGGLIGEASDVEVINCMVDGYIYGIDEVGGIVGMHNGSTIANSSFKGVVSVRRDIYKVSTSGGYTGGICGIAYDDIITNCYVVSEVGEAEYRGIPRRFLLDEEDTDEEDEEDEIEEENDDDELDEDVEPVNFYNGIIAGTGGITKEVSNCYYLEYPTFLPIADANVMGNNSSFTGSNYRWILTEAPFVNGDFRTDLVDALNAWVDENNSESIYRHWVADTANVNGGFPIFVESPKFVITFTNVDGTILQRNTLARESIPHYSGPTPIKSSTTQFTYVFTGWTPDIVPVTGDATYAPIFDSIVNRYQVTFVNEDGSILLSDSLEYGAMPYCVEPEKDEDAYYMYIFSGWIPEVSVVISEVVYTATYQATLKNPTYFDTPAANEEQQPIKIYKDGHIYILRDGKVYSSTGQEVE